VERFWHIGPGRTNLSHVKQQSRKVTAATLDDPKTFEQIIADLER
jgi:hypothetical protein